MSLPPRVFPGSPTHSHRGLLYCVGSIWSCAVDWDVAMNPGLSQIIVSVSPTIIYRATEGLDDWTFTTAKLWGETPLGVWTLTVKDHPKCNSNLLSDYDHRK